MSWTWLIAPVLGILAAFFGLLARNHSRSLGRADERIRQMEWNEWRANQVAKKLGVPRPTLDELERMLQPDDESST